MSATRGSGESGASNQEAGQRPAVPNAGLESRAPADLEVRPTLPSTNIYLTGVGGQGALSFDF